MLIKSILPVLLFNFSCQAVKDQELAEDNLDPWLDPNCGTFATSPVLIASMSPSTQIHPDILFADSNWWLSYNLPNDNGKFEVWLEAFDCDGSQIWGPELVSMDADVNHTVSRISRSEDTLVVIWQSDDGSGSQNLSIRYRPLDLSTLELGERGAWEPLPSVDSALGNAWMPALSDFVGGFWFAGAVAYSDYFSIVTQSFDGQLMPLSEPTIVSPDLRASYYPSIFARSENEFGLAYEGMTDTTNVYVGHWDSGLFTETQMIENAAAPNIVDNNGTFHTVMHHDPSSPTVYWDGTEMVSGDMTHTPSIAVGENGSLVTHYSIISGFQNALHWSFVNDDGEIMSSGTIVEDPPAAPYRTAVNHVGNDRFMVVWAGGQSPDFMLYGALVTP